MDARAITFRALQRADLPLMCEWLAHEHVRQWWHDTAPTLDEVERSYAPVIDGTDPTRGLIIEADGAPIGYAQVYRIDDHPSYAEVIQVEPGAVGLDLFIGEADLTGRGLGPQIIRQLLEEIVFADPPVSLCVIGPSVENHAAIRAYEKAGFVYLKTVHVPGETNPEYLMMHRRTPEAIF